MPEISQPTAQPSSATPGVVAATGVVGTSLAYARGDHVHAQAANVVTWLRAAEQGMGFQTLTTAQVPSTTPAGIWFVGFAATSFAATFPNAPKVTVSADGGVGTYTAAAGFNTLTTTGVTVAAITPGADVTGPPITVIGRG